MLSVNALQDLLAYSAWSSRRLVEAAAQLPLEQLTRDFGTADKSVLGTLVHIFAADRVWFARVAEIVPATFISEADYHLTVLQNEWPQVHDRWRDWAAGLTPETAAADLSYTDMRGNRWQQPVWQVVAHVVNHGTHHRGQAAGFLRSMGQAPPAIDMTVFYRTRTPAP
jgi:uncharacterized damage-inducible protein DinB